MYKLVNNFLSPPQLDDLTARLNAMPWEDGALTAAAAKNRKNNEQLTQLTRPAHPLLKQAAQGVLSHPEVAMWAEPRRIARIMFARYGEGMFYRSHNDAAITQFHPQPARADLSFTVFLNEPSEYEGGELVLETAVGDISVKGPAGSLVLYDTGLRHRVETIESGSRLVIVGWIESLVRSPQARDVLQDVSGLIAAAAARDPDGEEVITLRRVRANLLRMWAET